MKKWQLQEARKHLAKIVDDVLQGKVQAIVKDNGEVIYLLDFGQKPLLFHKIESFIKN
ncbi:type II toxin-antitoxin system prevent-host-death family antitoxin [Candidatus Tisiphia endosymbiont of Metellina segmentata]|uniref:type II toxin-antitoxin system prevent-host-death family antitoxin n=1 Tax=Candidatus Tisiphia endosymbiont of Metellina segmentata TaxID=3066274 RepID=UPI00313E7E92